MRALEEITLSNNQLYGEIPIEISRLSKLDLPDVRENELSGENSIRYRKPEVAWSSQAIEKPFIRGDTGGNRQWGLT